MNGWVAMYGQMKNYEYSNYMKLWQEKWRESNNFF